jgi:hypothetical protein
MYVVLTITCSASSFYLFFNNHRIIIQVDWTFVVSIAPCKSYFLHNIVFYAIAFQIFLLLGSSYYEPSHTSVHNRGDAK